MTDLYIVTTEAIASGIWLDDPEGFDDEGSAREFAAMQRKPPEGHCYCIYVCNLLGTVQENAVE